MANMNVQPMTKEKRQEKIIGIIRSNQYCNKQKVVNELKNEISRATVFDLLRELIKDGAVETRSENDEKKNARDYRLSVAEDNLLVSVRLELDGFEKAYSDLFNKSLVKLGQERINTTVVQEAVTEYVFVDLNYLKRLNRLVENLFYIFYSMVDAYLFRLLFIWSQKISDQQVLQQLYSMVFSKIADMQTRISESFKSTILGDINNFTASFILKRLRGSGLRGEESRTLVAYLDYFKGLGLEKEIEPVIDSLWKIIGDLQPNVYPEPQIYHWPFNYGEDDWRKLVILLRQHPKSTPFDPDFMTKIMASVKIAMVEKGMIGKK